MSRRNATPAAIKSQHDNLARARELAAIAAAERTEDVQWMADNGESLAGAAQRLGLKPDSLMEWLKDNGMRDIGDRMRARDPIVDPARTEHARIAAAGRWAS